MEGWKECPVCHGRGFWYSEDNGQCVTCKHKPSVASPATRSISFYIPPVSDDAKAFSAEVARQGLHLIGEADGWPGNPVFFYGSIEGMKHFQYYGGTDLDWCDWQKLTCTSYYAHWGDLLLTREYGFYPLAEVRRLRSWLWYKYWDKSGYVYFRPNDNDKPFGGGLFRMELLEPWLLQAEKGRLTDDLLCLVGKPTEILSEYRLVVANGKVITGSRYIELDHIRYSRSYPVGAADVAEEAAKLWSPHPMFVLDVAETDEGDYRIVECGSVQTAGLYDCDLEKVVSAIVNCFPS